VPLIAEPDKSYCNTSKWLLWQDPLLSLMDPQLGGASLREHYTALAKTLSASAKKSAGAERLRYPAQLARVLALKCDLRKNLAAAYKARDKKKLRALAQGDLANLRKEVDKLWRQHRDVWLAIYKPFGLEVLEQRYGFLRTRLQSLAERLNGYLSGKVAEIPELEAKLEKIFDTPPGKAAHTGYARVHTPSCIK
jgi:hypothetical protein